MHTVMFTPTDENPPWPPFDKGGKSQASPSIKGGKSQASPFIKGGLRGIFTVTSFR